MLANMVRMGAGGKGLDGGYHVPRSPGEEQVADQRGEGRGQRDGAPEAEHVGRGASPARFMPAAEKRPSGTLLRKTAATRAIPMPPSIRLIPMTADSSMPSSSAPMAIAAVEPPCSSAEFLRLSPPPG